MKRLAVLFGAAVLSLLLAACQGWEEEASEITQSSAEFQKPEETAETTESESAELESAESENRKAIFSVRTLHWAVTPNMMRALMQAHRPVWFWM